ncbi:hypothetical protein ACE7GA_22380 [Roseomonas sp. CCTCC AB2023176]|uniref:hypothetical protein n=1 Tax=Roseomonas sp. CCTCC AB2023176 TaxID=3342640 RepID=UPI0035D5EDB8
MPRTVFDTARLDALGSPAGELLRAGAPPSVASAADAALRGLQAAVAPEAASVIGGPMDRPAVLAAAAEARTALGQPAELPPGTVAALLVAAGFPAPLAPGQPLPPGADAALALQSATGGAPLIVALPAGTPLPEGAAAAPLGAGIEALSVPAATGLRQEPALPPATAAFWDANLPPVVEAVRREVQAARPPEATPASLQGFPMTPEGAPASLAVTLGPGPNGAVATGVTILAGERGGTSALGRGGAPLAAGEAPEAPGAGATLHLGDEGEARREALGAAYVSVTDAVPVPLDLRPGPGAAPLAEEPPRLWRLDGTAALVAVGPGGPAAAVAEGLALLARLREGGLRGLGGLRPGQGIATHAGLPAHLLLSGIARPGGDGVELTESAPPPVEVIRAAGDEGTWTVLRGGQAMRAGEPDEGLRLVFAYGIGPAAGPYGAEAGAVRARESVSAVLLAMEAARRGEDPARRRAALAALAADWAEEMHRRERLGPPPGGAAAPAALAMLAGLHGPLATWDALQAAGATPGDVLRAATPSLRPTLALALAAGAALALPDLARDAAREGAAPIGLDAARAAFAAAASALLRGEGSWRSAARALGAWGEAAIAAAPHARLARGDGLAVGARLGRLRG